MRFSALVGVLLVAVVANVVPLAGPHTSSQRDDLEARVDAYLEPYLETGNFSGALLIGRGDSVLLTKGYGWADVGLRVPNTPETVFHLASVSKPFTAAAILLLEQDQALRVWDPVSKYVPDFPNAERITLHHLLIHSTGIPNINAFPEYEAWSKFSHTPADLIARFKDRPLEFEPGERYSYSNSNYNLLAHIIETVSGTAYGEFLATRFFQPLGMTHTGHDGDPRLIIANEARGYAPTGVTDLEHVPYLDWTIKTGNGSLYSTVGDLFKWHRALTASHVLGEGALRKAFTQHLENVGYGWFIRERYGGTEIYINGRSPGFVSYLGRYIDRDLCVIVLGNMYNGVATNIGRDLAAIVLGEPLEMPRFTNRKPDPALIADVTGTYRFGPDFYVPNGTVSISVQDGHVFSSWGWLMPEGEGRFRDRTYWSEMAFVRDAEGAVTALQVDSFRGAKVPAQD